MQASKQKADFWNPVACYVTIWSMTKYFFNSNFDNLQIIDWAALNVAISHFVSQPFHFLLNSELAILGL